MKLIEFSVTNFRSIIKTNKMKLFNYNTLVGKNNEGKSNILKALSVALFSVNYLGGLPIQRMGDRYNWEKDFPISLQSKKQGYTTFKLNFELNYDEINYFLDNFGIKTNSNISIEINYGPENRPEIKILNKKKDAFQKNQRNILKYISDNISINYIPSIRTKDRIMKTIDTIISEELETIENDQDYIDAQNQINQKQQDLLNEIAAKVQQPLSRFLPNVKSVEIKIEADMIRGRYRRNLPFSFMVDDGALTDIENKGDGVKSLAALAMLQDKFSKKNSIIAIEEPESHLHPGAMHELCEVLKKISDANQVIITTHNPVFVIRERPSANIIINDNKAEPAKDLKEVRNILGIQISDNLSNAELVLVVEGKTDKKILQNILPKMSKVIKSALTNGRFTIQDIDGASNLSHRLSHLNMELYNYYVLLDDDEEAKNAFGKAEENKLISTKDCTFVKCPGKREAEFEDLINPDIYSKMICEDYGVNIEDKKLKFKGKEKWSNRLKKTFESDGKQWKEDLKSVIKMKVSECIINHNGEIFIPQYKIPIDSMISSLEKRLQK